MLDIESCTLHRFFSMKLERSLQEYIYNLEAIIFLHGALVDVPDLTISRSHGCLCTHVPKLRHPG